MLNRLHRHLAADVARLDRAAAARPPAPRASLGAIVCLLLRA